MAKLDREKLIEVIHSKQGVVSAVADALGVTRGAIYDAAKRWQSVQTAIDEARIDWDAGLLDEAEHKLREEVRQGKAWAVRYVLDKKGKARGYVESKSLDVASDGQMKVIVEYADDDHAA